MPKPEKSSTSEENSAADCPRTYDPDTEEGLQMLLADMVDSQIRMTSKKRRHEDDVQETPPNPKQKDSGIFLFSNSRTRILDADIDEENKTQPKPQKKPVIQRRKLNDTDSEDEDSKFQAAAVSTEWVISNRAY